MADVKTVRGTLNGATVETSEENAERLGSAFKAEGSEAKKTTRTRRTAEDDNK